jgi:hypothetical protein
MPPSTPQRWKRSCWPGIGSSAVNWTASGHTWATRVKKRVSGDCRKRPILARHIDRYGHPPACGSGNRQTASQQVFETLKKRGHPDAPPPLVSDGWGGVDEAIIAVYGAVPAYTGIGRPKASPAGLAVSTSGQTAPERPSRRNDIARGLVLALLGKSYRTHPSHDAALQWSPDAQDAGLFQAGGDVLPLGRTWSTTWPDRSRRCVWRTATPLSVGYHAHLRW